MNLTQMRGEFKDSSGFLHWTDIEINNALNRALKFLDRKCFTSRRNSRIYRTLEVGSNRILFEQRSQVIKDVWIMETDSRERLTKIDLEEIRRQDFTSGKPKHYLGIETDYHDKTADSLNVPGVFADLSPIEAWGMGLAFDRVADKEYYIEVYGRFLTPALNDIQVENWWSIWYPELLLQAAIYLLDVRYRNSSGGLELYNVIMATINEINNEEIEEELEGVSMVMEG